jgi:hypothetical protein
LVSANSSPLQQIQHRRGGVSTAGAGSFGAVEMSEFI